MDPAAFADYKKTKELIAKLNHPKVYATNNRYAYLWDRYQQTRSEEDRQLAEAEMKMHNFVPTYDKWCLHCQRRGCTMKCSGCKSVYFCDRECQAKAWSIHLRHCKRDQFCLCIACGAPMPPSTPASDASAAVTEGPRRCTECPVGYCSSKCYASIAAPHKEIDCPHFARLFGKRT